MKTVYVILSFLLANASAFANFNDNAVAECIAECKASGTSAQQPSSVSVSDTVQTEGFKIDIVDLSRGVIESEESYKARMDAITAEFSSSVSSVLEPMEAEIRRCLNEDPTDFEGLFKVKVKFNGLTEKAKTLGVSLLQGDRVEELFTECKKIFEHIDKSGANLCSKSNTLGDVCLYFDVENLKQKADEFYETSYEYRYGDQGSPTLTDPVLIHDYREYGLKLWKAANSYSVEQLNGYYTRSRTGAAVYYLKQLLDKFGSGENQQ